MRLKRYTIILLFIPLFLKGQCLQEVDFNEWQVLGNPYGQWFILNNSTVMENGDAQPPTFFVSPYQMINVRITGTMKVNYHNDDDYVGIVFGYQAPVTSSPDNYYHFILFDWKNGEGYYENIFANEGMTLSRVNMQMSYEQTWLYFWGHTNKPGEFEVLAKKYGSNWGWEYNIEYDYELTYTASRIIIAIDGDTVFNVPGCFEPGYFGFYSFSQQNSVFSNFNYELKIDFVPDRTEICEGESISFTTADPECTLIPPNIVEYLWDFGDGATDIDLNPSHSYLIPGDYTVKLTVTDDIGCQDSVSHSVRVNPIPVVDLGPDTLLEYGSDYTLNAGNPGAEFEWSTGEVTESIFLTDLRRDTMISVVVNSLGCIESDDIFIRVGPPPFSKVSIPNAFTPDGDGRNDTFSPVMVNVRDFRFMIYDRWGKMVYYSEGEGMRWDGKCGADPCPVGVYVWKLDYDAFLENEQYERQVEAGVVTLIR